MRICIGTRSAKSFRAFTSGLLLLSFVLYTHTTYADDIKKSRSAKASPKRNEVYLAPLPDPAKVAKAIPVWLKDWENPRSADAELTALAALFGNAPGSLVFADPPANVVGTFDPPARIKKLLLLRRLNYRYANSRRAAVHEFQHLLVDDVEMLISIAREGLNDTHRDVRDESVLMLQNTLLLFVYKGSVRKKWNAATKARMMKQRNELTDVIVDLLVTKGLTDDNEAVAHSAYCILLDEIYLTPTLSRLRALDRVMAKRHVHPEYREAVQKLRDKWHKVVHDER